jgi:radical SAM protein with 4Fe4S-binding SPASM domain
MIKTRATYGQMEQFFDQWIQAAGWAVIAGQSSYNGLLPDQQVMNLAPPIRFSCVQIRRRAMVLSDGRVLPCDQDPQGAHAVGNVASDSLTSTWQGQAMQALRANHDARQFDALPICPTCTEWHRP